MLRLVLSRFAARGAVQAALLVVIALAAALLAGSGRGFQDEADRGVRALVAGTPVGVRLQTGLADGAQAQDAAARRLFAQRFAGIDTTVTRSVTATLTTAAGRRLVALADAEIAGAARLESGGWPEDEAAGGAPGCAVQADAAAALGLAVGDQVALSNGARLRVVGTWRAADPTAPRWHGEPAPLSGADGDAAGPFVLTETSLAQVTGTARVRWVVTPQVERLDEQAAARLADAAAPGGLIAAAERAGGIGQGALTADGDLADAAARAVAAVRAGRTSIVAPQLAAGAVALVTVLLLAGLLASVRLDETRTLRARGASTPQLAVWSVVEGVLVALPGAALGWALGGADPARRGTAALVGCLAALLVAGRGIAAAGPADQRRHGVVRATARAALAVVLGLGAVLAVWQLRRHGPGGAVATAASALALLAGVLAVTSGTRPVGRLLARRTGRWRRAFPALAAVQVARGTATLGVAGLVAALGLGTVGLTAVTAASTQRADRLAAERAAVADLRVQLEAPDVVDAVAVPVTSASALAVPGIDHGVVALTSTVQVGGESVALVAAPAAELPRVLRGDAVPDGVADLVVPTSAEPLDGDLRVGVAAAGADSGTPTGPDRAGAIAVTAWLADPQGALVRMALPPVAVAAAAGPASTAGELPAGGPWSLVALDATLSGSPGRGLDVTMTTPAGRALSTGELSSEHARGRVQVASAARALPVLVTTELAASRDLRPGSALTLALRRGGSVGCVVAGVVARVPGATGSAVLADLGSFAVAALASGGGVPAPDELWLAAADPAAAAVAVREALPYRVRVTTVAAASTAPVLVPVVAAAGRGAVGAALLSVVGLSAAAAAMVRARREEDAALRALGVRGRGVAGLRAGELAVAVVAGAVAGVAGALVAAWACVGPMAAAAVPGAPAVGIVVGPPDGRALAWAGGAALVVLAVALATLRPSPSPKAVRDAR
jgi:hypothetical protein